MRFLTFVSGVLALATAAGAAPSVTSANSSTESSAPTSVNSSSAPTSATSVNSTSVPTSATSVNVTSASTLPTSVNGTSASSTPTSPTSVISTSVTSSSTPTPPPVPTPVHSHEGFFSPNSSTVWTVGTKVSVTWNVSEIHNENGTLAAINLYNGDDDYPLPILNLARNFPSNTGVFDLEVPDVGSGCYYIKIKGYCGCNSWRSEIFKIIKPQPPPHHHTKTSPTPGHPTGHSSSSVKPTSPTNPSQPTTPINPSQPTSSTSPSQPTSPTSSSQPTSPPTSSVKSTSSSAPPTSVSSSSGPAPTGGITSPTTGTVWTVNTNVTITFDTSVVKNENGTLKAIELFALTSKTPVQPPLATNFVSNTGSVVVSVPNVPNGTYHILIESFNTQSWTSNDFTIQGAPVPPPSGPAITSPTSSTTWTIGAPVSVTWNKTAFAETTIPAINLFAATAKTPVVIGTNVPNSGSYTFTLANVTAGTYRVSIDDQSTSQFQISA